MNPVVKNIIDQLKPYNAEKIILFGSYAHGKPTQDSDVDLLVVKETSLPFLERQKHVRSLFRTTTPVDIFIFTPDEFEKARHNNPLIKEAIRSGKTIYG